MRWNHKWGTPHTMVVLENGQKPLHTARQRCLRCRATRNPISGGMVIWGHGRDCRDNPDEKITDWSAHLALVEEDLRHLELDGRRVDRNHTGRTDRQAAQLACV